MYSEHKVSLLAGLIYSLLFQSCSSQTVTQGFSASSYSFPISSCAPGTFIGQVSSVAGGTYSTDNPNISVNPTTGQLSIVSALTGNINFNVFSRSPSGILSSAPVTVIASCNGYTPVTYTQPIYQSPTVYQTPTLYQSPYYATAPVYPTSPYFNTGYSCANGICGTQNNAYAYNPRYYGIRNSRWSDSDGDSFYFGSDNTYPNYLNNGNYFYNGLSNNYDGYGSGSGRICVAGACFRPDRTILNGRRR